MPIPTPGVCHRSRAESAAASGSSARPHRQKPCVAATVRHARHLGLLTRPPCRLVIGTEGGRFRSLALASGARVDSRVLEPALAVGTCLRLAHGVADGLEVVRTGAAVRAATAVFHQRITLVLRPTPGPGPLGASSLGAACTKPVIGSEASWCSLKMVLSDDWMPPWSDEKSLAMMGSPCFIRGGLPRKIKWADASRWWTGGWRYHQGSCRRVTSAGHWRLRRPDRAWEARPAWRLGLARAGMPGVPAPPWVRTPVPSRRRQTCP